MAAGNHSEKPIHQYLLHQLAKMIKMSSMRFFRELNRLEAESIKMKRNKDHAKFNMAAILLRQFLFTYRVIIDTGSPWARISPRAPPPLYHFDQGTPVNDMNDVTSIKWDAIWASAICQKCRDENRISPVLIHQKFRCLHLCFHGQRIEWNHW